MQHETFEKLQYNQLKLVVSFCQVKLEILNILVESRDPLAIDRFSDLVSKLAELTENYASQLHPKPGESAAERALRLRGIQAVVRSLERHLFDLLVEMEWLMQWSQDEPMLQWERETFDRTVYGLIDIIEGQIDLLVNPQVGSPVEPSYF